MELWEWMRTERAWKQWRKGGILNRLDLGCSEWADVGFGSVSLDQGSSKDCREFAQGS